MKKRVVIAIIISFVALASCDKDLMNRKKTTYDIVNVKGLLDTLALSTWKSNPLIIKYSLVNGVSDTSRMQLDSAAWEKELQLFAELNIRSSRLVGRYSMEERSLGEEQSVTIWRANAFKNEDLDSLKLWQTKEKIFKIEFFINEQNNLFKSRKYYRLTFLTESESPQLQAYHISGDQKMQLNDSSSFEVSARLNY